MEFVIKIMGAFKGQLKQAITNIFVHDPDFMSQIFAVCLKKWNQ
jgi:hypothetical protein